MPKATRTEITKTRAIVAIRDQGRCVICGCSVVDIPAAQHHRRPKGSGGSALLEMPSNKITVCGHGNTYACHGRAHKNQGGESWINGWLIYKLTAVHPSEVPLLTYRGWVLLDDLGGMRECEAVA